MPKQEKSTHVWIGFSKIKSNPYRDLVRLPLVEEKVSALEESIHETGFWDNVVVREVVKGNYELAYGHHRIAAAKRAGLKGAYFIVKTLTDKMMIAMMSRENAEVYGNDIRSILESVRATVQAYAAGKFGDSKELIPPAKTKAEAIRYAPSFLTGMASSPVSGDHPYSTTTIARFLGHTRKAEVEASASVTVTLRLLEQEEKKQLVVDDVLKELTKKNGALPIFAIETYLKAQETERIDRLARFKVLNEDAQVASKTATQQREQAEKAQKEADAKVERLTKAAADAAKADAPTRAKLEKERLEAKKVAEIEQKKNTKAARAAEKKALKEAQKTLTALRTAQENAEAQKIVRHESFTKRLRETIDTIMEGDQLYDSLKVWKISPLTTDKQRGLVQAALYRLNGRVESFNVHVSKPIRKGEK